MSLPQGAPHETAGTRRSPAAERVRWPRRLRRRLGLALDILESHWSQPATALFRIFEVEVVQDHLRAGGRALDLGCGDGTLAGVLLAHAGTADWLGADLDPREVRMARGTGLYRALYAASADQLPARAGSLDLVFANSALEHMERLDQVLAEVARVLAPGGRFVFTVPGADFHRCLFWPGVLGRTGGPERRERYLAALDRRLAHVSYLSRSEWQEALSSVGLEVERVEPYLSPRALGWWETLANLTGGVAHALQRKRRSPREVQLRLGIGGRESPVLGALAFAVLLPVLLWTSIEARRREGRPRGALYVECVKVPKRGTTPGEPAEPAGLTGVAEAGGDVEP